jgi:dihydroorotase-like cyclic amidohydrolase
MESIFTLVANAARSMIFTNIMQPNPGPSRENPVALLHANIRSLTGKQKMDYLLAEVINTISSLVAVTETWLDN